ncbi:uncharacterized protein F5891DRAFT_1047219 [Suillus fuscotomentosus]|uniref:Uncharacterized protein n=1 Tax=Suillus fuscotomentosus TaxID=1912939 RepID=A0AAD4HIE2_9AGAM|nr:uncharacterized protein F5891DRAFT_1047219 [Suillus fuscotomentosus]KAG1897733.1 hypothetical protein F5891DRAFT_1047219 [Suillus fuscotomentosus]
MAHLLVRGVSGCIPLYLYCLAWGNNLLATTPQSTESFKYCNLRLFPPVQHPSHFTFPHLPSNLCTPRAIHTSSQLY